MTEGGDLLFAYGTLQDPGLLRHLLGRVPPCRRAWLEGYARYTVAGQNYPGIVAEAGAETPGSLLAGIRPGEWTRLDDYESELYERLPLRVRLCNGSACVAYGYVIPQKQRHVLSDAPWDPLHYLPLPNVPG